MKKGSMFTVEAFLAVFMVVMVFFFLYSEGIKIPKFHQKSIEHFTYDCLRNLDLEHGLRNKVGGDNRAGIVADLQNCVPGAMGYNVTLCDWSGCDNIYLPDNKTVVSSSYYVAGREDNYTPTEVRIYGWEK